MACTINASVSNGIVQTADGSGLLKVQSGGVTTNALAWVNFNGTTSPGTIRSQYNVSSVTKTGTGAYTVNFTTTLSDANYAICGSANNGTSATSFFDAPTAAPTTSAVSLKSVAGSNTAYDADYISVAIFGN